MVRGVVVVVVVVVQESNMFQLSTKLRLCASWLLKTLVCGIRCHPKVECEYTWWLDLVRRATPYCDNIKADKPVAVRQWCRD
ncbi:hypothetical protein INR49_005332 [Caranx melampygus]|nr:hypothetical protein INR49_005332 [Caranx melampygus]